MAPRYSNFPVLGTIDLKDVSDIRNAVDKVVDAYEHNNSSGDFSYRILLPRGDRLMSKAKKLGMTFQGEFILTLRKRNLVPVVRDLRYVHDESHYGWLLASPAVFEKFEGKA